jgi:hypothetical protein
MRLQVPDDFLCRVIRNRSPIGFDHLVYFRRPCIGRQRRLHGDIPGAVTCIAVGRNFLLPITGSQLGPIQRVRGYFVGCTHASGARHRLTNTSRNLRSIKSGIEPRINGGTGEKRTDCGDQREFSKRSHLATVIPWPRRLFLAARSDSTDIRPDSTPPRPSGCGPLHLSLERPQHAFPASGESMTAPKS